jgi:CheY-like chemotaxis protein
LVHHVRPDVPDALVGDAGRLRQVLLNLVGNAIKFTDKGEVEVRVEVGVDVDVPPDAVGLRFTVRDTGIGIPKDQQERVFRAFEQEDASTTRRYGGTGLGLTISARLVALMGGQITVESEPGRGSTFTFTARFGRQPHPPERAVAQPPVLLRDLSVLVVDDNDTNRHILDEWLRGWQMRPAAVGGATAALEALRRAAVAGSPYPLVLLDVRMPDTDGLALAALVRHDPALTATRIILLTSGERPGDAARARELQVDAHLLKPVQPDELLAAIHRALQRDEGRGRRDEARGGSQPPPVPSRLPHPSSLRILVAEDNEFSAQLLEQLLGRRGHRVRVAADGREALTLAETGEFDVLLLDVHMPELDGFQVIRAIRERERASGGHLPVVALTARSRPEDRERCLAAGMDDFLPKPVRADDLFAAIDRVAAGEEGRGMRARPAPGLSHPSSLFPHPCRCSTRGRCWPRAGGTTPPWGGSARHCGPGCRLRWRRCGPRSGPGTRPGCERLPTNWPGWSRRSRRSPARSCRRSRTARRRASPTRPWWSGSKRWPKNSSDRWTAYRSRPSGGGRMSSFVALGWFKAAKAAKAAKIATHTNWHP